VARQRRPVRSRRLLRAIVVGASAGGYEALNRVLAGLSPRLRTPLIVVLHIAASDNSSVAESFGRSCPLPVVEAGGRTRVMPGHVHVAPPGYHLLVEHGERFALSVDERVRYSRPSIDVLFESAADVWRAAVAGVVLTGANDDGAQGLATIRSHGGIGIVQAPDDAEVSIMPAAALKLAGADHVVTLGELAPLLNRLSGADK
jgi:two-component system, chemotaxis family, protein-glutamate methylesterase/glutaminase